MIGRTLGHYEIVALIGRGGMGEVYRARDTRLDRSVALKVLPDHMASDRASLERFQREAKTVAGLNHPHIVTIHSVEEEAGVRFLTMELVEGQTLDKLLPADGFPLTKVFEIGIAVADALAAAHEKGIVHRDLKPGNVMVATDGRVKVLDFGLAKLATAAEHNPADTTVAPLTTDGTVMGTVPYMSPEQLRAGTIDHRSDIFSFGILLFEIATGRRPFFGASNADVSSAILNMSPPSLTQIKPSMPQHLGRIVSLCLEKEPEQRIQSAKDIRNELRALRKEAESGVVETTSTPSISPALKPSRSKTGRWIAAASLVLVAAAAVLLYLGRERTPSERATTDSERSIAVLPFVNMSSDADQEYFSDGISEELLNLLSKVSELRVAARTSSFSFKGKDVAIPEIARQLNVSHVLEGSVRKAGTQVRITAQLIHAADGFHVWSQTYDRQLDDVFAIQDEIAADVVKELKLKLLGEAPKVRATDPEAYSLYLQAVQFSRRHSSDGLIQSDSLYHRVLAIDPRYLPALDGLAKNAFNKVALGVVSGQEGFDQIRDATGKALAIDPDFAPAHMRLGIVAGYEGDLAAFARHFERALALDPTNLDFMGNAAIQLMNLGRSEEAITIYEFVGARDPINVAMLLNTGLAYGMVGRNDEAIARFRTAIGLSPDINGARGQIAMALVRKGEPKAALEEIQREPNEIWRAIGLPVVYHALGRSTDSDSALAVLVKNNSQEWAYNIAGIYAFRNEPDRAFEWLDKAVEVDDPGLAEILADPLQNNIKADPRWLPFLRKIGKAPEQLAKIQFKVELPE